MTLSSTTPLKLFIDTDPGIDDCHALMMALSYPNVQILGISIVTGNTSVENGVRNIHYLLHTFDRKDIPVFRGADRALDGRQKYAPHVHGEDGFGNATEGKQIDLDLLSDEPAAVALVRLARENRGELVLAAIGPLTNVFLAHRLDPEFSRNLKYLYIMGGNCTVPRYDTLSSKSKFE
jgi:purine nucleosidase